MDEQDILSRFDNLVESGKVLYDRQQRDFAYIDGDLEFHFLVTSALANKTTIKTPRSQAGDENMVKPKLRPGSDISTEGFEVGNIGSDHYVAVNKFCYARPHLMLLTSDAYKRQYEPLYNNDLEAMWTLLSTFDRDYLAFFNCAKDSGCSRLHKHMQLIPKPAKSFAAFLDADNAREPDVPFQWFYHRFDSAPITSIYLSTVYSDLVEQATRASESFRVYTDITSPAAACPHNMILSKRWMIVISRRQAAINKEAGANALGMLGVIAVATDNEVQNWVRLGLTNSLSQLGVPR
ncbi:hypothetical protein AAFC00_005055 [Neodothiora populina]|uniref:ATP adenylyltransferase n=1 Tax=Neodothiora populina TaxID=2781224 RepID=A0ABR3PKT2_9PEZI